MRRIVATVTGLAAGWLFAAACPAQQPAPPKKYEDFDKVVEGAKQYDGLFRLFHKENHLYAEIRPDQFNKNFLCPVSVARGLGEGGHIRNFGEQWALAFRRPDDGYQPRLADDRVGYFLSAVKDFTSDSRDTPFLRYVNRWRLERADGKSEFKPGDRLSPPKKKIVFWIEKSVPDEYRAAVREGILEWNKAFEKIGFRDAIEVRQQENEDFDPEDVNYNTFRWIAEDRGYAMGPSRANPFTGE